MTPPSLDAADLERRLRAVEPAARVVRERLLRKLLHKLADAGEPVAVNPRLPVWVSAERVRDSELFAADVTDAAGDRVLLLPDPADRLVPDLPLADVLRYYWRLLFWARVADAVAGLDGEAIRDRLDALGPDKSREARFVLETDHVIPRTADDRTLYAAFAATHLTLLRFDRAAVGWYFPTLSDSDPFTAVYPSPQAGKQEEGGGLFERLFSATRPDGASDPAPVAPAHDDIEEDAALEAEPAGPLTDAADRAAARGNYVRAAILRVRAAHGPDHTDREKHLAAARSAIRNGLVKRLAPILGWPPGTASAWGTALVPLLDPAAKGVWPAAARALYDLQKIVTDLRGELSTVDPVEWVRTLGRRPLRRPLTRARSVVLLRHLRTALTHVLRSPLASADRDRLERLVTDEMHAVEARVRDELGPVVRRVLEDAGFIPVNEPERVAKDKLVAELLDRVRERGFLRFGDLRDAVARNRLKMPDLASPGELLRGDALLRADVRLAEELDGVYRRGEVYLRTIQRGTALAFGTPLGRWLMLFVVFPFGGAFMAVEGAKYLWHEGVRVYGFVRTLLPKTTNEPPLITAPTVDDEIHLDEFLGPVNPAPPPEPAHAHGPGVTTESLIAVAVIGSLVLLLLHSRSFRSGLGAGLATIGRAVRFAVVELPGRVWRSSVVRAVRDHPATRLLNRHFGTALVLAVLVAPALALLGASVTQIGWWTAAVFLVTAAFVSTPVGRRVEDRAAEAVSDSWREVRVNLVPGIVGWVLDLFRTIAGWVERGLYAVDEWFRFRQGQSSGSLATKAVLAALWFPVAYVFRFAFYLLFEPQVNPVKHFPIVTVSHKLLLPQVGMLANLTGLSIGTMTAVVTAIPGIFGFIAWELKENWRLYAANRPRRLTPVVLGHHGETLRGLLRPGFHSGTVPKLYRKLRRAARKADRTGKPADVVKATHGLDEIRHAVELFVERELVPLLRSAAAWKALTPRAGAVRVGVQSIVASLAVPELGADELCIVFAHENGTITARLDGAEWVGRLTSEQDAVLRTALAGFAEMGAAPAPSGCVEAGGRTWDEWVAFWDRATGETV